MTQKVEGAYVGFKRGCGCACAIGADDMPGVLEAVHGWMREGLSVLWTTREDAKQTWVPKLNFNCGHKEKP